MCVYAPARHSSRCPLTRTGRRGFVAGDPHLAVITRDPIFFRARSRVFVFGFWFGYSGPVLCPTSHH